ncbi:MAG: His/Gly/Thr/Pro-type tRNA ligase C-terminal domain-containing protein, partial [Candidatus Saccharibacteria bacterium]|nr:His/Gly/Thr/Pro-type tRNA ligase C-terminal domain-containing protein [Candidatus Saccharibacteria bacterium]
EVLDNVELNDVLPHNKIRYSVDESSDSLGKKIKRATELKIPAILIVGPRDVEEGIVSVRLRDKEEKIKLSDLAGYLKKLK